MHTNFQKFSELGWYENFLWLTYVVTGAIILYFIYNLYDKKYKYLLPAYFIKVFGGLFFALIYVFYYKG